jgi:hypothetical protein
MSYAIIGFGNIGSRRQHDCCRCASKAWGQQGRRPRSDLKPRGRRISFGSRRRGFGGATPVEPKTIWPTDPAARYTAAADKPAVYAYSDDYLIDLKHAVIMDVEATTAIRQAEVGAAKAMLDRRPNSSTSPRRAWSPMRVTARPR